MCINIYFFFWPESVLFSLLWTLLPSRFSRVRLCATPWTAAHQASPSLGFSRQEHWSGLPFPSPMHESEKWKWSRSSRVRPSATPWTAAYQASPSMGFSRQEYWSGVPLPSPTNSQNLLQLMSIESVIPSNRLILCRPLLLPPSIFPSIRIRKDQGKLLIKSL